MGPKVANTLVRAGTTALEGQNFVESLKKEGKAAAEGIVSDVIGKATSKLNGNGSHKRKRKRKTKKTKINKKRRITRKRKKNKLFL